MGFNVNEVYASQSDWLKAADLNKQEHAVTIANVHLQEIDENGKKRQKLELEFVGKDKRLLLNKTNGDAISYIHGPDTDAWIGKEIILYPTQVDYQGRQVEAIRVRIQLAQAQPVAAPVGMTGQAQPQSFEQATSDLDDDIPF